MRLAALLFLAACSTTSEEAPELPEDPAAAGYAVGVRSLEARGESIEVWYPAEEGGTDTVDLSDFVPQVFLDHVGDSIPVPTYEQAAQRDAALRTPDEPLPVVVFSHGFGGYRAQSTELTAHLASRGYVVVSADHPGRTLSDVVPCLFDPAVGTCEMGFPPDFDGVDPAIEDLGNVLDWMEQDGPFFADAVDLDRIGLFGHSAGGGSTSAFANEDTRITAALPLAGSGAFTRDLPSAVIGGSCDAIVREEGLSEAGATASQGYYSIVDAGHLAFSDLCIADLGTLADQIGERDDANPFFILGMRSLATDGCPTATPTVDGCDTFLDLDTSGEILRHSITVFFDETLKRTGPGLDEAAFDVLKAIPE